MIELIPAIDIIDGKCVRLIQGDYNNKTIYHDDPVQVALHFEELGIKRLHVVDLDGAKSKHIVNIDVLKAITTQTNLIVDFGGGIKTDEDLEEVFANGAKMVTIGSIAITNKELFQKWVKKYGTEKIILGADVQHKNISINGWKEGTDIDVFTFLDEYVKLGIKNVLCTDISKDGTLQGPSFELYQELLNRYPTLSLIASGGVSSNDDIYKLNDLGVSAVVFGKAFYEGNIDINKLIK